MMVLGGGTCFIGLIFQEETRGLHQIYASTHFLVSDLVFKKLCFYFWYIVFLVSDPNLFVYHENRKESYILNKIDFLNQISSNTLLKLS